jgi:catechol 2,3-dioxygenase-like lactoylglutathione lyase family enzyme
MAKLNHIGFFVSNLEKSLKFYNDIFGFKEVDRFMVGDSNIATMDMNGALLELIQSSSVPTPPAGNWSHLAIVYPEFDEAVAKVTAMNIEKRMMTMESGDRLCFFNDPDGHTIEVASLGL